MIKVKVTQPIKTAINKALSLSGLSLIWKSELEKALEEGYLSAQQYKRLVEFVKKEGLQPMHQSFTELQIEAPKLQEKEVDPEVLIYFT
jgi:hypothetical protein